MNNTLLHSREKIGGFFIRRHKVVELGKLCYLQGGLFSDSQVRLVMPVPERAKRVDVLLVKVIGGAATELRQVCLGEVWARCHFDVRDLVLLLDDAGGKGAESKVSGNNPSTNYDTRRLPRKMFDVWKRHLVVGPIEVIKDVDKCLEKVVELREGERAKLHDPVRWSHLYQVALVKKTSCESLEHHCACCVFVNEPLCTESISACTLRRQAF